LFALIATADHDRVRYATGAATFHILSDDGPADLSPAMAYGCLAAAIV
jgi:hypothetical protein